MAKVSVIIAAAGKGDRFGGAEKKTFAKLDGRPVFLRTIEHFLNRDDVCQIILAVSPEDMETVKSSYGANLGFLNVILVEGGARRCETVAAALKAVSDEAEFIAVHDAARPCVTSNWIDAVFAEAVKSGSAILAAPVTETLKKVSDAKVIEKTLSRSSLFEAQTPQVFRKDILLKAYQKPGDLGEEITDDAQLVEDLGESIAIVISDRTNLKITTKGDLSLARAIIKARPSKPIAKFGAFEEAQW